MQNEARYPHCNAEVLHHPGECEYCDEYPERQQMRVASNTPFTPNHANGWPGNVAWPYARTEEETEFVEYDR